MRSVLTRSFALLLIATPLLAQEAEGPKPGLLSLNGGLMFWTLVVFVGLMFFLRATAWGPLMKAVTDREQALQDAIDGAKQDRAAAAALLEQHRKAIEAAHAQQAELLERARRDIDAEKTKAIDELRREAIDLALAGASKVIEKNLDDVQNRKLVESYLSSIK
jgi:F-type H+-transporting ATPase subunit b